MKDFSRSVNVPPISIPKTKDQLKEKNGKLRKELDKLRKQYQEVYKGVQEMERQYEESKQNLIFTRYGELKEMIKQTASEEALQKSQPPDHKHSVYNKGVENCFSHSTSEAVHQHSAHMSSGRRISEPTRGTKGFLQSCREFAGKTDTIQENKKDVNTMHKAEIEADNEQMKHHIQSYDSKFLRLHNRLARLRQDYDSSKEFLILRRYGKLKAMIKVVTKDEKLKPD